MHLFRLSGLLLFLTWPEVVIGFNFSGDLKLDGHHFSYFVVP